MGLDSGLPIRDIYRLTLWELNEVVKSHRRRQDAHNIDIADSVSLATLGYHDPKKFSKAVAKFRQVAKVTDREKQQIKQEAEALGVRVPK